MAEADCITALDVHPAAEIFPLIEGAALVDLAEDIRANGLREPITLHPDGRILDGRNRYRACGLVGVEPHFRTWDGVGFAVDFVRSLNALRRHLTPEQEQIASGRYAIEREKEARERQGGAGRFGSVSIDTKPEDYGRSREKAAEAFGQSEATVARAVKVLKEGTPELVQAVERGDVAVSTAAAMTDLEPEVQTAIVNLPEPERKAAIKAHVHVAQNSGNNEWYTPPEFIEAARDAMGGITIDPASSAVANSFVRAEQFFTIEDDGLKQKWRGNVWMNPPYSQPQIAQFAEAVCDKFESKEIKRACVLVNNATETSWFQRMLKSASAVCFLRGRIKYLDETGRPANSPLQGQAILYFGENPFRFEKNFSNLGSVLYRDV